MGTNFGPESPRPLSVCTERHLPRLRIERDPFSKGLFNFGPVYNARFAFELGKIGEIDCDDRVAYVGPNRGSALSHLQSELSLVHPPLHLLPSTSIKNPQKCTEEADEGDKWRVDCSAEHYFHEWRAGKGQQFDRIVVRDSHGMFEDPPGFYADAMKALEPRRGKLILVHRPVPLTTLPFKTPAIMDVLKDAPGVSTVLHEFSVPGHDVEWETVRIPMLMSKIKWLSMLYHRFPIEMSDFTDAQVSEALRELIDGPFKYCGNSFECEDVLLFACMSSREQNEGVEYRRAITSSNIGRHKGAVLEMSRSVELSCGGPIQRNCELLSPPNVNPEPTDKFPLVQSCHVDFVHDLSHVYRV